MMTVGGPSTCSTIASGPGTEILTNSTQIRAREERRARKRGRPSASRDDVGSDRAQEALAGSRSVGRGPRPDRLLGRADRSRQIDRLRAETAGVVELAQRVADAEYRLNCLQRRSATGRQAAWAYVRELEQLPSRRSVPLGPSRSEATALVGAAVAQARLEIEIEERLDAEQRAVVKLRQRLDRMQAAVEVLLDVERCPKVR